MALAKVKTAEEMARLDAIWAELEAHKDELEEPKPDTRPQAEIDEENRKAKEARLENQDVKQIVSNAKNLLETNAFKTKWERVLAKTLIGVMSKEKGVFVESKELGQKNTEINLLRNFATAVSERLEKAERSAREQDNHHYYKIFADGVKSLLESL